MAKKAITLEALATQMAEGFASVEGKIEKLDERMERSFATMAGDIADIKHNMATKDQIVALHGQVNAIETDIRSMRHTKLDARVADLEEKVFGAARD
jgi:hypothetical protein